MNLIHVGKSAMGKQGEVAFRRFKVIKRHKSERTFRRELTLYQFLKVRRVRGVAPALLGHDANGLTLELERFGTDLADLGRALTPEETRALLDALNALHQAGWEHGDISAANVLVDARGRVRLVDFGNARRSSAPEHEVSHLRRKGVWERLDVDVRASMKP